ncbi:MAG: hypothetical protein NTV49_15965 [Kiritimatiellaeota bacterium]|nr:hypothetical protein [Kiritimatiellota bacterium]
MVERVERVEPACGEHACPELVEVVDPAIVTLRRVGDPAYNMILSLSTPLQYPHELKPDVFGLAARFKTWL